MVLSSLSSLITRKVGIMPPLKNMVKVHIKVKNLRPTIFFWLSAQAPHTVRIRLISVPRPVYSRVFP